jgi:tetratricopeptide (TPR) repeat protein
MEGIRGKKQWGNGWLSLSRIMARIEFDFKRWFLVPCREMVWRPSVGFGSTSFITVFSPRDREQLLREGQPALQREKITEALASYDKCLERDPNYIHALNNKGNALESLNRHDEALVCFEKCLERDPNYIHALNGKGAALRRLNRSDEALVWFDKCLERDPNYIYAYNSKGYALHDLKRHDKALVWFD